jgi:hypothetical protein
VTGTDATSLQEWAFRTNVVANSAPLGYRLPMFRGRREGRAQVTLGGEPGASGDELVAEGHSTAEPAANGHGTVTLDTSCLCGHTRRTHMGLQIVAKGRCLECECGEFTDGGGAPETDEDTVARINAAIEQVERLIGATAALLARSEG